MKKGHNKIFSEDDMYDKLGLKQEDEKETKAREDACDTRGSFLDEVFYLLFYQTTLGYSDLNSGISFVVLSDNPELFRSQLSYFGLNLGISFLDEVFHLLFYQTTLSYSGLNSVILVSTQVFHF
jgi:hypothetical protein